MSWGLPWMGSKNIYANKILELLPTRCRKWINIRNSAPNSARIKNIFWRARKKTLYQQAENPSHDALCKMCGYMSEFSIASSRPEFIEYFCQKMIDYRNENCDKSIET